MAEATFQINGRFVEIIVRGGPLDVAEYRFHLFDAQQVLDSLLTNRQVIARAAAECRQASVESLRKQQEKIQQEIDELSAQGLPLNQ